MVRESYQAERSEDVTKPTPGIVLAVKKNGKVSPGGPQAIELAKYLSASDETETCLKLWVHTEYDSALSGSKKLFKPR